MWSGTLSPVASTGMSSYLLKLMPVFPEPNSSYSRRSSRAVGMVQSTSWLWLLSFQRPPPPPLLLLLLPPPKLRPCGSCHLSFLGGGGSLPLSCQRLLPPLLPQSLSLITKFQTKITTNTNFNKIEVRWIQNTSYFLQYVTVYSGAHVNLYPKF